MPKSRKKKSASNPSLEQEASLAAGRAKALSNRRMRHAVPSPYHDAPGPSTESHSQTLETLLDETTERLNDTLRALEEKSHEVNDLENELALQAMEIDDLQQLCDTHKFEVEDLLNEISYLHGQSESLQKELTESKLKAARLSEALSSVQNKFEPTYSLLRNERRKTTRAQTKTKATQALLLLRDLDIQAAEDQVKALQAANFDLEQTVSALESTSNDDTTKLDILRTKAKELRKKIRKYQMRSARAPTVASNAVAKAKTVALTFKLTKSGAYTPQARALARKLERRGCSQEFVGMVIQDVCKAAGVDVDRRMSRRTVGRAIGEGAVAAKIQIIDEMAKASSALKSTIDSYWGTNSIQASLAATTAHRTVARNSKVGTSTSRHLPTPTTAPPSLAFASSPSIPTRITPARRKSVVGSRLLLHIPISSIAVHQYAKKK